MIDLHTHILYESDDGAESIEVCRQMLARCREQQILTVAATSHSEQCSAEKYHSRFSEVSSLAETYGVRLLSGMEYLYADLANTPTERLLPLAGKNYLLLDLRRIYPDFAVCRNLEKLTSLGFHILLAHPERLWNPGKSLTFVRHLTENQKVHCQLNAGSILGIYGRVVKTCAFSLLEAGSCMLIASDAHNSEKLNLPECRKKLLCVYPENVVKTWMETNPAHVIAGEELELPELEQNFFTRLRRRWKYWI